MRVADITAALALLLTVTVAPLSLASDFDVEKNIQTRESVEKKDFDGFICNLKEGDKMSWYITVVSGDLLDIYVMAGEEYDKLKSGGSPIYFSQLSKDNTDFDQDELTGTGNYLGQIVLVIQTQGTENSSAVYDIEIKIKKEQPPSNPFDPGMCAILIIGGIVVVVIIYYIFRRFVPDIRPEKAKYEERGSVSPMEGMVRPGFDVVTGPAAEPPKPRVSKKKAKTKIRATVKGPVGRLAPKRGGPIKQRRPGRCPSCAQKVDEGQGFCSSCGADLE